MQKTKKNGEKVTEKTASLKRKDTEERLARNLFRIRFVLPVILMAGFEIGFLEFSGNNCPAMGEVSRQAANVDRLKF